MLREYGHCWIARALFEGSDNFDEHLGAVEAILGEVGVTVVWLSRGCGGWHVGMWALCCTAALGPTVALAAACRWLTLCCLLACYVHLVYRALFGPSLNLRCACLPVSLLRIISQDILLLLTGITMGRTIQEIIMQVGQGSVACCMGQASCGFSGVAAQLASSSNSRSSSRSSSQAAVLLLTPDTAALTLEDLCCSCCRVRPTDTFAPLLPTLSPARGPTPKTGALALVFPSPSLSGYRRCWSGCGSCTECTSRYVWLVGCASGVMG